MSGLRSRHGDIEGHGPGGGRGALSLVVAMLLVLGGACDAGTASEPVHDADAVSTMDVAVGDEATPDAAWPDAPAADAAPDAPSPDAPLPDAAVSDVAPDTSTPDAGADTPTPDAPTPDAPTPDAPAPDAPTPDAPLPDSAADAGPDGPTLDAAPPDSAADAGPDTPTPDAPSPDSAPDAAPDSPTPDAAADTLTPPTGPFGTIDGPCSVLASALDDPAPSIWIDTFAFDGDPFDPADLDPDALVMFEQPNAGGASKCSEVFSMELMDDCLDADLYKTEMEILYIGEGSITDYEMLVGGEKIGVSVTRAYKGPYVTTYAVADAVTLLTKKLAGVNEATGHVAPEDAWSRQILHVWTLHATWADMVVEAWTTLGPELKSDTVVLVTVETGSDFVVTDTCDD